MNLFGFQDKDYQSIMRMQFLTLVSSTFLKLIIVICHMTSVNEARAAELRYFGNVDRELKFIIVGGNDVLLRKLEEFDEKSILDHKKTKTTYIEDLDILTLIVDNWGQIDELSEGDDLYFVKKATSGVSKTTARFEGFISVEGSEIPTGKKDMLVIIYVLEILGEKSLDCYAKDILGIIVPNQNGDQQDYIFDCKSL